MGIHGMCNSFKKRNFHMSKTKVRLAKRKNRRLCKRRAQLKKISTDRVDTDIMTVATFGNKKFRAALFKNRTLSGKKRNKILKALRYAERDNQAKQAAVEKDDTSKKATSEVEMKEDIKPKRKPSTSKAEDAMVIE